MQQQSKNRHRSSVARTLRWRRLRPALLAILVATLLVVGGAPADDVAAQTQDHVLWVTINGGYNGDGVNAYNQLVVAGADADYLLLNINGEVATAIDDAELAGDPYDQVWVYDLSTGADAYPDDYQAIADWFDALPDPEMICDGRFLSSYWFGRHTTQGRALAENYYVNFAARGGGRCWRQTTTPSPTAERTAIRSRQAAT